MNNPADAGSALTHFDTKGDAHMVNIAGKALTHRKAVAGGRIQMQQHTLDLIQNAQAAKGDVLGVARIAAIQGAKRTAELIPLCHPLPITRVAVDFALVCATHCKLAEAAANGKFRHDLYYRINGLTVTLPALRERSDLVPLTDRLLADLSPDVPVQVAPDLMQRLTSQGHVDEKLSDALVHARQITNFEGRRRQMQFIGKLMRKLSEESIEAVKDALNEQRMGSTKDTLALHLAESWRDRLMAEDTALQEWMNDYPSTDSQQLRALVRQARKDDITTKADIAKGLLPRQSRAYREIFQLIKEQFNLVDDVLHTPEEDEDSYKP